jgi:phosphoglycerol transferase MdoB-like AlkP superfamily enzyme
MQKYNNEQLKELIGFFKVLFSISSVILISIIASVFQEHSASNLYNILAYMGIAFFIHALLILTSYIIKFIKQLGEK